LLPAGIWFVCIAMRLLVAVSIAATVGGGRDARCSCGDKGKRSQPEGFRCLRWTARSGGGAEGVDRVAHRDYYLE
jgi:hypothetical protein